MKKIYCWVHVGCHRMIIKMGIYNPVCVIDAKNFAVTTTMISTMAIMMTIQITRLKVGNSHLHMSSLYLCSQLYFCILCCIFVFLYFCPSWAKKELNPPASTHSTAPRSIRVEKPSTNLDKNTKELVSTIIMIIMMRIVMMMMMMMMMKVMNHHHDDHNDNHHDNHYDNHRRPSWQYLQSFKEVRTEQRPAQVILYAQCTLHTLSCN